MTQHEKTMQANSRCHVNSLSDSELDSLLDVHLFGNPFWCAGEAVVHYPTTKPSEYRCNQCAAVFEYGIAERIFGAGRHKRVVSHYTVEQIAAGMTTKARTTQFRFALAVRVSLSVAGGQHRSITTEFLHLLTSLTTRLLAIAVLNALDIIDAQGYFLEEAAAKGGNR